MIAVSVSLLVLQVVLLVLTGGIFVTTMLSANASLSLMRRTLSDASRSCRALDEALDGMKTRRSSI